MTCPDPQGKYILTDGVEMPMGKGIDSAVGQSSLLYNEYPLSSVLLMCSNLAKKVCLKQDSLQKTSVVRPAGMLCAELRHFMCL